jgi:predicted nuclease of predicted toxin-antitoxin system
MMIWVDAQISPAIATWISANTTVQAVALRDIGLRDADDHVIFSAAKRENAIIMTKDDDFVSLVERFGQPPQIIWVRCGNTSNARLIEVLMNTLRKTIELLQSGEKLVEINAD